MLRRRAHRRVHRARLAMSRTARAQARVHPARRDGLNQHRAKWRVQFASVVHIPALEQQRVRLAPLESPLAELPRLARFAPLALSAVELLQLAQSACQESTMMSTGQQRANLAVPVTAPMQPGHENAKPAV